MTPADATNGDGRGSVHLSLQGKGGVGKSMVASILAQYLAHKGLSVQSVDTDPVNHTLSQYAALGASRLELLNQGRIDPVCSIS